MRWSPPSGCRRSGGLELVEGDDADARVGRRARRRAPGGHAGLRVDDDAVDAGAGEPLGGFVARGEGVVAAGRRPASAVGDEDDERQEVVTGGGPGDQVDDGVDAVRQRVSCRRRGGRSSGCGRSRPSRWDGARPRPSVAGDDDQGDPVPLLVRVGEQPEDRGLGGCHAALGSHGARGVDGDDDESAGRVLTNRDAEVVGVDRAVPGRHRPAHRRGDHRGDHGHVVDRRVVVEPAPPGGSDPAARRRSPCDVPPEASGACVGGTHGDRWCGALRPAPSPRSSRRRVPVGRVAVGRAARRRVSSAAPSGRGRKHSLSAACRTHRRARCRRGPGRRTAGDDAGATGPCGATRRRSSAPAARSTLEPGERGARRGRASGRPAGPRHPTATAIRRGQLDHFVGDRRPRRTESIRPASSHRPRREGSVGPASFVAELRGGPRRCGRRHRWARRCRRPARTGRAAAVAARPPRGSSIRPARSGRRGCVTRRRARCGSRPTPRRRAASRRGGRPAG